MEEEREKEGEEVRVAVVGQEVEREAGGEKEGSTEENNFSSATKNELPTAEEGEVAVVVEVVEKVALLSPPPPPPPPSTPSVLSPPVVSTWLLSLLEVKARN